MGTIYTGVVLGIDDDGKLIVKVNDKIEYLFTGEVTLKKKEV
jgi:biotin-(acetyl-CoA carboxylase) ligase